MNGQEANGSTARLVAGGIRHVRGQIMVLMTLSILLAGALLTVVIPLLANLPPDQARVAQQSCLLGMALLWVILTTWIYVDLRPVGELLNLVRRGQPVPPPLQQLARTAAFTLPIRLLYFPVLITLGVGLVTDLIGFLALPYYPLTQHLSGTFLATIAAAGVSLALSMISRRWLRPVLILTAGLTAERGPRFSIRTRQTVTTLWLTLISIGFLGLLGYQLILKEARYAHQIKYTAFGQSLVRYVAPGLNDEALVAYVETLPLEEPGFAFILDAGGQVLTRAPSPYRSWLDPVGKPPRNSGTQFWDVTLVPLPRAGRVWQLGFIYRLDLLSDAVVQRALVILLVFTGGMLLFVVVIARYVAEDLSRDLQDLTGRLQGLARQEQVSFEQVRVLSLDEVGDLTLAFNEIQNRFQRLYQENEARRQEAAIMAQVAQIVNSTLELEQVLNLGLEQLKLLVPYDSASILLMVEESRDLMIVACAGFQDPERLVGTRFTPEEKNLGYQVMLTQTVRVLPDVQQVPEWGHTRDDVEGAHTIRSWIGVPLVVQGQSLGLLTLDAYQPEQYTDDDGRRALAFATHIATAVQNARLYQTALSRARDLALLYELSQQISGLLDPQKLLYAIVHRVQAAFGYAVVSVHLLESDNTLRLAAQVGMSEEVIQQSREAGAPGQIAWVAVQGQPLVIPDVSRDDRATPSAPTVRSLLTLPLLAGDIIIGIFNLESSQLNAFQAEQIRLFQALSHQIAVALENADLFASERAQAAELARLAHTLAAEKRKLDAILRNVADGLVVTDLDAEILLVNPAFERMFGCTSDQVVGQPLYRVIGEPLLSQLLMQALYNGAAPVTAEIALPDGRTLLASALSIQEVETSGVVTVLRDVTHDKALERMKSEFVSAVSHELRTPLTSILGFAKLTRRALDRWPTLGLLVKSDRTLERMRRNLDIMVAEGERLTALINDVLDIAAMDAGQLEWHDQLFELPVVLRRQVELFKEAAQAKGLLLQETVEPNLPPWKGDPERIGQVISNLLSNALKFTERGVITVTARRLAGGETAGGSWRAPAPGALLITVTDTGIGIAADALEEIFQRFRQGGDLLRNKPQGTGLGLAISREIIRHYGGEVWAESTPGVGSTFYVTLPLKE